MDNTYPTVELNNGRIVLAKSDKGYRSALTYANRTQAYKRLATMPDGWDVCQFLGRPFYIAKRKEI